MIKIINFLKFIGLGRGFSKKINNFILKIYLNKKNIKKIKYNYHGKNFILYPLDNVTDSKIITSSKKYDSKELEFIKRFKKNNKSIFLDIGSNMGYYSIMSSSFGFNSIFAFEPLPKMISRIEENIKINELNNIIKIIPFALGDTNKEIIIFEKKDNIGGSSILNYKNSSQSLKVNMITLNQFINDYSLKQIDVLKIDIEGYEDRVLMPFFRTNSILIFPKLVIIEHSSSKDWNENVIEWMLKNGYSQEFKTRGNTILKFNTVE